MNDDEKLSNIMKTLDEILKRIESIENHTKQMTAHINFINKIYLKYKNIMDYIHSLFNKN